MGACWQSRKKLPALGALPLAVPSLTIAKHAAACPACRHTLQAERLGRGLFAVLREGPEPPAHFVAHVLEALPVGPYRVSRAVDPWHAAWGLIPAFAALAGGLFILYHPGLEAGVSGLLPTDDLSASERLVFGPSKTDLDLVAAAVLREDPR